MTHKCRGQFVLLTAIALVIVLLPLVTASLQLGYHADLNTAPTGDDPVSQVERLLDRLVHEAAAPLPGNYSWQQRATAIATLERSLSQGFVRVNRSGLATGTTIAVTTSNSTANDWAASHCPRGPARVFGPCRGVNGVIIQNRANRTHVLAVATQLSITTRTTQVETTLVIEVWPD